MPARMGTNAPVGPPICTLLPPSAAMIAPAMIAVHRPCAGVTPEAMPKPIASGSATMPTVTPAAKSEKKFRRLLPRKHSINFGLKKCIARVRLSAIPSEVACRAVALCEGREESLTIFADDLVAQPAWLWGQWESCPLIAALL